VIYGAVAAGAFPVLSMSLVAPLPPYQATALPGAAALVQLARRPPLWRASLMLGLYVGAEVAIAGWLVTYLQQQFGWTATQGAWALSGYWGGFLLGRLASGALARQIAPWRLLAVLCAGAVAASLLGALAPVPLLTALAYALTGASISGIFPTVIAVTLQRFPGQTGPVTAMLVLGGAIGSTLLPGIFGLVGQAAGMRLSMLLAPAVFAIMLVLVSHARRHTPV
jgi:fucose permease